MAQFVQQVVAGLSTGSVFAALALALVLIHRATGVINFAQGEMAMFTTYIAWTLGMNHGWSYWPAFVVTLLFAFVLGLGIQRAVIAPVAHASVLSVVIVTIGLLLTFNGLASFIWSPEPQAFPSPFPNETWQIGGRRDLPARRRHARGRARARRAAVGVLPVHEDRSRPARVGAQPGCEPARRRPGGLDARDRLGPCGRARRRRRDARARRPSSSRRRSCRACSSTRSRPPSSAGSIRPFGAVVGGLLLGVGLNLIETYIDFVGADLKLPVALLIILVVLLVRPAGIFGKPVVRRV